MYGNEVTLNYIVFGDLIITLTLEGCPKEVSDIFNIDLNPVEIIYDLFTDHQSVVDSLDYNYFRGENVINKIRLTQALEEIGLKCPTEIEGYKFVD